MSDTFTEIEAQQAWQLMQQEQAVLVDIRDELRFNLSHPAQAIRLTNENFGRFCDTYDFEHPVIVSCYHGVSSRNVAQFLVEQGYDRVYSLKGGFDGWRRAELPIESENE